LVPGGADVKRKTLRGKNIISSGGGGKAKTTRSSKTKVWLWNVWKENLIRKREPPLLNLVRRKARTSIR